MFILKRVACRTDTRTYPVYNVKTYPMCDSPFRSTRQSFAPLQKPRFVNRSHIRYGFRAGAKAIRYNVNWSKCKLLFANIVLFSRKCNSVFHLASIRDEGF